MDVVSIDEVEEIKIDLIKKDKIIGAGSMRAKLKKIVNLLILKKSLMERKKVSKKGFLIKKKDFQEKDQILETKIFTSLILCWNCPHDCVQMRSDGLFSQT